MNEPLSESVFDEWAERTLRALDSALNEVDGLEVDLESGILTLEFADRQRFVINSHRAARQIWMAAGATAWHFDLDPSAGVWTATKSHEELWDCIKRQLEQKLGRPIELAPG